MKNKYGERRGFRQHLDTASKALLLASCKDGIVEKQLCMTLRRIQKIIEGDSVNFTQKKQAEFIMETFDRIKEAMGDCLDPSKKEKIKIELTRKDEILYKLF